MTKRLTWIPLFLICSCSTFTKSPPAEISRVTRLNQILDDYFEAYLVLDPLFASAIGDHRYDSELPISILPEHRAKQEALMKKSLRLVQELGCVDLPDRDRLTCMTFEDDLKSSLALLNSDLGDFMPFNQFASFPLDFAELASGTSYVTFENKSDYQNFMSRLRQVPGYLNAFELQMKKGVTKGITAPRALVQKGLKNLKTLLSNPPESSPFFKPIRKFPDSLSKADQAQIIFDYESILNKEVLPAYQAFTRFIETDYLVRCRKSSGIHALPGGRANYMALVRYHTTTSLHPNEIMNVGLREVTRIRKEFEKVKERLGFKGDLKSFYKSLRTNPELFPYRTHEAVLDGYHKIHHTLEQAIPVHFRLVPKAKFDIREVEKFKAETAGESYQNPSADGSRPGIFWVPIPDPSRYQKKSMEALFLHEAIPGHHFQISLQQELDLPRYRKFNGNNAYVEGWGLYAESLGQDLGLYSDPYEWVGRLEYEMHRAIRLVVDTGIHWKGWSRERAIQYSLENEPMDLDGIVSEIERYMAIPGQALSYKIGELKIQELKTFAKSELGVKYSDPDFHDEILKDGALPLSVLESKIKRWISARK